MAKGEKAIILETKPEEANRISQWFEDNDRQAYLQVLSEIALNENLEDESSISGRFMEWIDARHESFKWLLGTEGGYFSEVHNFVQLALERNSVFIESTTGISIPVGGYAETAAGLIEQTLEEEKPRIIPKKGTVKKWDKDDAEFINESIRRGDTIVDSWNRFLAIKISEGRFTEGRTYASFSGKHYRTRKKAEGM